MKREKFKACKVNLSPRKRWREREREREREKEGGRERGTYALNFRWENTTLKLKRLLHLTINNES